MAYYTKVLQPDETVKVIGRLHWWIYGRGAVVLGLHGAELSTHLAQFHQHHFNPAFQPVIAVIDPTH